VLNSFPFCDFSTNERLRCFVSGNFQYSPIEFEPCVVGIVENSRLIDLKLWPNPVFDVLNFKSSQPVKLALIRDLSGRAVDGYTQNGQSLNVSGLEAGAYLIYLKTDQGWFAHRFIKS
jgi:hypothetical protein